MLQAEYAKETESFIEGLRKELNVLKISDEYNYKVSSWRSQLKRFESQMESYEYGHGMNNH